VGREQFVRIVCGTPAVFWAPSQVSSFMISASNPFPGTKGSFSLGIINVEIEFKGQRGASRR
jgi:hypothetical protein